jgi:hypothetical protein
MRQVDQLFSKFFILNGLGNGLETNSIIQLEFSPLRAFIDFLVVAKEQHERLVCLDLHWLRQ